MADQIQKIIYEGYLADDGQLKYFPNGGAVFNFRIGSTRKYNKADGTEVKETTWFNCSINRTKWAEALAEQKLEKGSHVIVFGRLRVNEYGAPRTYQRKDGSWVGVFDVTVEDMRILRWGGSDYNPNGEQNGELLEDGLPLPY
jgi:single-strand DNA-binding protein